MSKRSSFFLALLLLLLAAFFRLWQLTTLPPGFQQDEINDLRITETVRQSGPQVFYDLNGQGREGLYQTFLAATTSMTGTGLLGYRMLSVWIGLLTLAVVYALARRLLNPLAALAALGLLSIGFWPSLLARTIARETFVPLLVAAAMLALAVGLPIYRRRAIGVERTIPFAALGLLLGLGFYIHPIAYLIALFSMVFIAYVLLSRRPVSRWTLNFTGFAIVVMVVIVMPYLISCIRLPALAGASRLFAPLTQSPMQALVNGFGGLFFVGDMDPAHNLPKRPLVDLVSGFLLIAGLLTALLYRRQPRFVLLLVVVVILTPAALLASNSPNFLSYSALLPVFALFFGLGVSTVYNSLPSSKHHPWLRPLVAGIGLLTLLAFNIRWTAQDLFAAWPQSDRVQQAYDSRLGLLAYHLDLTSVTTPTVICTTDLNPPEAEPQLSSTQILALMMNRQDAPLRYVDCGTGFIFSSGGDDQQVILPDAGLQDRVHPYIRNWLAMGKAETGSDVPPDAVIRMNVSGPLADTIGRFTTTAPTGYAPESPGGSGPAELPVSFGDNVTFLGYEPATPQSYAPGDVVTSITYWRVDGPIPSDLRFFTHILSDPAAIVAQSGSIIRVIPDQLQPRDVFIQITFVWLPQSIPNGVYSVSIGAYDASSDARLDVFDGNQPRGNRLFLNQITVKKP